MAEDCGTVSGYYRDNFKEMRFSLKEFVFEQRCIPWKVRLLIQRVVPWQVRRLIRYGKVNLNTPEAMDERYLSQGDEFISMENLYEYILPLIPSEGRLLDAGCGIGVLLRLIRSRYPFLELFGVDFSPVAVERTRNYGFNARIAVLPDLPYPDEYFDCIVSTEVLEHLDNPEETIRSFNRVLRERGQIIVSVPYGMGPDHCSEHVQDFSEESLSELIIGNGFELHSIEKVDREPARKPGSSFVVVAVKKKREKNSGWSG